MADVRETTIDIGGTRFDMASDDAYLEHMQGVFEPDLVQLLRSTADGSEVALDVGANVGCTAILLGSIAGEVHAFEPSPTTSALLERNVARSGLTNVTVHAFGLGERHGESELTHAPSDRSGGFVSDGTRASAGHVTERVRIEALDDVMGWLGVASVDFIKLDVEGYEGHVIRGAAQTLARCRPVAVMELNHWCLNAFQRTSIPDHFDLLRSVFPVLRAVDGSTYLDLHDESDRYLVMYHHILNMRFANIVAAYDAERLTTFDAVYTRGFRG